MGDPHHTSVSGELCAPADSGGKQLLLKWNQTSRDYPRDRCIPELFQARVKIKPEAIAIVYQDHKFTYRELNESANQLAHRLRALGVKLETPVGVYVDRSAAYVVCVLGILKAGGTYVPLDTEYPLDRLRFMLKDADVPVVVADRPIQGILGV